MEMSVIETECSSIDYLIKVATKDAITFLTIWKDVDDTYTYGYNDMYVGGWYEVGLTLERALRLLNGALQSLKLL